MAAAAAAGLGAVVNAGLRSLHRGCVGSRLAASRRLGAAVCPPSRSAVTSSSGAIMAKPKKTSFGLLRISLVVVPFLYVGTLISKNFAALLEEHDIFVPEDDDDDD